LTRGVLIRSTRLTRRGTFAKPCSGWVRAAYWGLVWGTVSRCTGTCRRRRTTRFLRSLPRNLGCLDRLLLSDYSAGWYIVDYRWQRRRRICLRGWLRLAFRCG